MVSVKLVYEGRRVGAQQTKRSRLLDLFKPQRVHQPTQATYPEAYENVASGSGSGQPIIRSQIHEETENVWGRA